MLFIPETFYVTMVLAGYAVQLIFDGLGLIPPSATPKSAKSRFIGTTPAFSTLWPWLLPLA